MLNVSPANLMLEVRSAQKWRDRFIPALHEMRGAYGGPFYRQSGMNDLADLENTPLSYMSLVLPRTVYDNPRVRVKTRREGLPIAWAEGLKQGINRWAQDYDVQSDLELVVADAQFGYGCCLVKLVDADDWLPRIPSGFFEEMDEESAGLWDAMAAERGVRGESMLEKARAQNRLARRMKKMREDDGGEIRRLRPAIQRLSPEDVFWDPEAKTIKEIRFIGYTIWRDKEDLLREARENPDGWNIKEIEALEGARRKPKDGEPEPETPDRNQVEIHVVWIPEIDTEIDERDPYAKLYRGTVYHIAQDGQQTDDERKSRYVRPPIPYFGHPFGPIEIFGILPMPGSSVPLSGLQGSWAQHKDLNANVNAQSKSARNLKTGLAVSSTDPTVADTFKDFEDGGVFTVDGFETAKSQQFKVGGADPDRQAYIEIVRERLDRTLGISDAVRGNVTGVGTATENQIASASADARMGYIQKKMWAATSRVLSRVAWLMFYTDRIILPISDDASGETQWFIGGNHEETGLSFFDLEIELDFQSLERVSQSEEIARETQMLQAYINIAPLIAQFPYMNWVQILDDYGEAFGKYRAGAIVDQQLAAAVAQLQMESLTQAGSAPAARLAGDSGKPPAAAGSPTGGKGGQSKKPQLSGVASTGNSPGRPSGGAPSNA